MPSRNENYPNPLIIDVSEYQGAINWPVVRDAGGVDFAIIRAGYGVAMDARITENAANCVIPRTFYHFFHPEANPERQAARFYEIAGGQFRNAPPACDFETIYGSIYNLDWHIQNRNGYMQRVVRYLQQVEYLFGEKPLIYTGAWFWTPVFQPVPSWPSSYDLWIADYYHQTQPDLPSGWSTYRIWQQSSNGHISGIPYRVDVNAYNGTRDQFLAWIDTTPPPAPQPYPYTARVTAAWLNVRNGPGTEFPVIGWRKYNDRVSVTDEFQNAWAKIEFGDGIGWVSLRWLQRV